MVKEFSIFKDEPATYDSVERFKEICEYSYQKDSYKHIFQVGEKVVELFDHLSRIKTLKPSLKKRYLEALDILL